MPDEPTDPSPDSENILAFLDNVKNLIEACEGARQLMLTAGVSLELANALRDRYLMYFVEVHIASARAAA